MSDLFVTGITGLVGRAVASELTKRGHAASVLVRGPAHDLPEALRPVTGDLGSASDLDAALLGADKVLHIAALTGAASASDLHAVNVEGTRRLVEACVTNGVSRFVFVSSIAAAFENLESYPYGASKRDAESIVRESGLDWVVVRPTVVIGPGSAILERFAQLAGLPISPLPGGGDPRIQPIAASDLASCLVDLVEDVEVSREVVEIGGSEVVTLLDFLREVRVAGGKRRGPVVRVPLAPIRIGLTVAAGLTGGRFPVSPAQLAMFAQDGVAEPHDFVRARRDGFLDLQRMLARGLSTPPDRSK